MHSKNARRSLRQPPRRTLPLPSRLAPGALACLAALASGSVMAQEPNPFYVGASQAFTRESNFFRVQEGQPATRETVSATSLLAGLDQPIGRHRLFADAALRAVRHDNSKQLDHTGGSLLAGLDWSAIDVLSGRVSLAVDRTLARYGSDFGFIDPNERVLQTSKEFIFRGQYGLVSLLTAEAGYVRRELDFSVQSGNQFEQDTFSAGLKYRPVGALTLGVAARHTQGSYPFAQLSTTVTGVDDFKRDDLDLLAIWTATGASTVTARLSYTNEKHEGLPVRDVSGATGAVAWNYRPTAKLNLTADYIRDTGAESSFNAGAAGGVTPIVNSSPLSTTWQLRGDYDLTAKLQLQAMARHFKRELLNTVGDSGDDTLLETRLGVTWSPLRSVQVGCSLSREKRETSTALSTAYSANVTRCLAQFKTQ